MSDAKIWIAEEKFLHHGLDDRLKCDNVSLTWHSTYKTVTFGFHPWNVDLGAAFVPTAHPLLTLLTKPTAPAPLASLHVEIFKGPKNPFVDSTPSCSPHPVRENDLPMRFPHQGGTTSAIWEDGDAGDQVQKYVISVFAAIAWCNALELIVLCFSTFKRYRGCYFWSLLISSVSLIPHCLGYIFYIFSLGITPYVSVTLILLSWCVMVTGHSLVLWSRLTLVLQSQKVLKGILTMIIVDAIILHVPTIVLMYGSIRLDTFAQGYDVMERIQLVWFCVQEVIISGTYIWETAKTLRIRPESHHHKILAQLLITNVVILILDIAVVGIEYAGYYALQVMFKPVAYSIKFKLEYAILGRLIQIAKGACSNDGPLSYTPQESSSHRSRQGRWGSNGQEDQIDREIRACMEPVETTECRRRSTVVC